MEMSPFSLVIMRMNRIKNKNLVRCFVDETKENGFTDAVMYTVTGQASAGVTSVKC